MRSVRDSMSILSGSVVALIWVSSARGQDLAQQAAALKLIRETAAEICTSVPIEGRGTEVTLTGDAKAKLDGVIGKVIGLGIDGGGQYKTDTYKNVLRQDLASAIKSGNDCRLSVLIKLSDKLLPAPPVAPTPGGVPLSGTSEIKEVKTADGSFRKEGSIWIEYPAYAPGSHFSFNEVTRDGDYIYLSDPSRMKPGEANNAMLLRLPTHGGMIQWSYSNPVAWINFTLAAPGTQ